MSAIAGILSLDDSPIDVDQLGIMAEPLMRRFPDGIARWCDLSVGLIHTRSGLDSDSQRMMQPLGGKASARIVFDGHIDDRSGLRAALAARGEQPGRLPHDPALMLAAYRCWGERCVERVLGDFAFAVWDGARKRLYCGRDRFGVRPLYYAHDRSRFAFSSDLAALLRLPWVARDLHESALADFLLFGYGLDPAVTPFRAIRQVPPAHLLVCEGSRRRSRRYWSLQPGDALAYRHPEDYVEHFRELFDMAVADRVPDARVGVLLSGGMDSTAVLAAAARARGEALGTNLRGYTWTAERLCPQDEEGRYAGLAAASLSVPLRLHPMDDVAPFDRWALVSPPNLAPLYTPYYASHYDLLQQVAADGCRVLLSGEGGDPSMLPAADYLRSLFRRLRWGALLDEVRGTCRLHGTLRGMGWRRLITPQLTGPISIPNRPAWLDSGLVVRLDLEQRWQDHHRPAPRSELREQAMLADLSDVSWYESRFRQDEGVWTSVELRYPFFDLRVIDFFLAIPQYLSRQKRVVRAAMAGRLPQAITSRPKTPFRCDSLRPWIERLDLGGVSAWSLDHLGGLVDQARYAKAIDVYRKQGAQMTPWDSILLLTPIALGGWMRGAMEVSTEC